jgi:carbamoyl-phosphate synthase large subunit
LKNGEIHLIVNTTEGKQAQYDSAMIRRAALQGKVYYTTTLMVLRLFAKHLL